jgi:hypothetical protein
MFDEHRQCIDRLPIQFDPQPVLAQLAGSEIEFERRKAATRRECLIRSWQVCSATVVDSFNTSPAATTSDESV